MAAGGSGERKLQEGGGNKPNFDSRFGGDRNHCPQH